MSEEGTVQTSGEESVSKAESDMEKSQEEIVVTEKQIEQNESKKDEDILEVNVDESHEDSILSNGALNAADDSLLDKEDKPDAKVEKPTEGQQGDGFYMVDNVDEGDKKLDKSDTAEKTDDDKSKGMVIPNESRFVSDRDQAIMHKTFLIGLIQPDDTEWLKPHFEAAVSYTMRFLQWEDNKKLGHASLRFKTKEDAVEAHSAIEKAEKGVLLEWAASDSKLSWLGSAAEKLAGRWDRKARGLKETDHWDGRTVVFSAAPPECTEREFSEFLPEANQVFIPRDDDGKPSGYMYGEFASEEAAREYVGEGVKQVEFLNTTVQATWLGYVDFFGQYLVLPKALKFGSDAYKNLDIPEKLRKAIEFQRKVKLETIQGELKRLQSHAAKATEDSEKAEWNRKINLLKKEEELDKFFRVGKFREAARNVACMEMEKARKRKEREARAAAAKPERKSAEKSKEEQPEQRKRTYGRGPGYQPRGRGRGYYGGPNTKYYQRDRYQSRGSWGHQPTGRNDVSQAISALANLGQALSAIQPGAGGGSRADDYSRSGYGAGGSGRVRESDYRSQRSGYSQDTYARGWEGERYRGSRDWSRDY